MRYEMSCPDAHWKTVMMFASQLLARNYKMPKFFIWSSETVAQSCTEGHCNSTILRARLLLLALSCCRDTTKKGFPLIDGQDRCQRGREFPLNSVFENWIENSLLQKFVLGRGWIFFHGIFVKGEKREPFTREELLPQLSQVNITASLKTQYTVLVWGQEANVRKPVRLA